MSVTRDVIVKGDPILMERESKYDSSTYTYTYYAIGSYDRLDVETYTADKIKTITLIDLNTTAAPANCVATWDASYTNGDETVTAWLVTNAEDNTMYDLYLGAEGIIYAPSNSDRLFGGYENCVEIKGLNNLDTSNVTDMKNMFWACESLECIDVSNFDTSKVLDMRWMFMRCISLTNLDLSNFDTRNVTRMDNMFEACTSLTSLDVSNFVTSNVTEMKNMFSNCSSLASLKLGQDFDKLTGANMFNGCSKLKAIITPRTTIMTLNDNTTTSTGLKALPDAILYVPTVAAETTFEADVNYADILGADRIRPILELVGDTPININTGDTYEDA